MKLVRKNSESFVSERIDFTKKELPCLDSSWHYHSQYELLYISSSFGIRFVGDSVSPFSPGDLVLVGPFVPHLWRNDISYYKDEFTAKIQTIVLKFSRDFIGKGTFEYPEFSKINDLLEQSKFGISFSTETVEELHDELIGITELSSAEQSIKLLEFLIVLANKEDRIILSSTDMRQYTNEPIHRLDSVLKYISDNYTRDINLQDVSDIACLTSNSFCRFFKKKTNKSFTQFLNEVRVKNASRLLVQQNLTTSEVCYMVGYKSITNFYRHFKNIMGVTPKNYRSTL